MRPRIVLLGPAAGRGWPPRIVDSVRARYGLVDNDLFERTN